MPDVPLFEIVKPHRPAPLKTIFNKLADGVRLVVSNRIDGAWVFYVNSRQDGDTLRLTREQAVALRIMLDDALEVLES